MDNKQIKIYVLTTGDVYRVDRMREILGELKYSFLLSPGMDELSKLEKHWRSKSHKFRQKAVMAGEIGAFKNHINAWKEIAMSGKPGIVIEDNADFINPSSILTHEKIESQIYSCGLVSFTDFSYQASIGKPFIISSIEVKKPLPIVCYGLTPERAANLVRAADKTGFVLPVDKWLSLPKMCGVYGYVSNLKVAKRKKGLASIANKKRGRKTLNPINMIFWAINKIKYGY